MILTRKFGHIFILCDRRYTLRSWGNRFWYFFCSFILCVYGVCVRTCACAHAHMRWQTCRCGKYSMHVEAREQHQVLVLAFYFVWDRVLLLFYSFIHQVSWPLNFWDSLGSTSQLPFEALRLETLTLCLAIFFMVLGIWTQALSKQAFLLTGVSP